MLLVIDAGNTHTVCGVFDNDQLLATWRIVTAPERTSDEYGLAIVQLMQHRDLSTQQVRAVAISCVAPHALSTLVAMAQQYFHCQPLVVTGQTPTGMPILYQPARSLGADRLVNSVAAAHLYGTPTIVVDLGTATTIDCVSMAGEYLGGAIAPGMVASLQALLAAAPGLPRVELQVPAHGIGTTTTECLQSGLVLYAAGAIDALIRTMKAEMQANPIVIATGGLAPLMSNVSTEIRVVNEYLTLHGLRIVFERCSTP